MSQYLVKQGINITIVDSRGNDAVEDARREDHLMVHIFLDDLISNSLIERHCNNFAEGLFR